jgi:hypothetical protein
MEGVYYLRHSGAPLESKPFAENTPLVLRVGEATEVPAAGKSAAARIYKLHYVGVRAGQYDLRDYLVRVDGSPPLDVEPIPVAVTELLPPDHAGDLEAAPPLPSTKAWSYRTLLYGAGLAWSLPLAWFILARLRRRSPPPPVQSVPPLSIEAQLQALAEAASAGRLDPADQARLERLLIAWWRECLDLGKLPTTELLAELSRRPQTSELLCQLESWLYRPPGAAPVDVATLLAPYRQVAIAGRQVATANSATTIPATTSAAASKGAVAAGSSQ